MSVSTLIRIYSPGNFHPQERQFQGTGRTFHGTKVPWNFGSRERKFGMIAVDGSLAHRPIYFNVSWLVDNLYVDFAEILPAENFLYAKNVTPITIRKCQQRVTSSTYVTGLPTFFQPLVPNPSHFTAKRLKKCQNAKNITPILAKRRPCR